MHRPSSSRDALEAGPGGSSAAIAAALLAFALVVNFLRIGTGPKIALTIVGIGLLFVSLGRVRPGVWWELGATRSQRELIGDRGVTWFYQILGWAAALFGIGLITFAPPNTN